jgi:hypothetical protein
VATANGATATFDELFKDPKELRYRKLYFPNADEVAFDTKRKGFVPLPILLRKLMRHLSTPEFRVLVYLHLRAGRYGVCYPAPQEMVFELGLGSTKNLTPYLRSLEQKKLISSKEALGRTYYLVHDPRVGLQHSVDEGTISGEELCQGSAGYRLISCFCHGLHSVPSNGNHGRTCRGLLQCPALFVL